MNLPHDNLLKLIVIMALIQGAFAVVYGIRGEMLAFTMAAIVVLLLGVAANRHIARQREQ